MRISWTAFYTFLKDLAQYFLLSDRDPHYSGFTELRNNFYRPDVCRRIGNQIVRHARESSNQIIKERYFVLFLYTVA